LCDTHTAVAVNVYQQYQNATGDTTPCVIASTASPYKFASAVLPALSDNGCDDEFAMLARLSEVSGTPIPAPLADLHDKKVIHTKCVNKTEMSAFIKDFLK
jgi:threonine synthase